MKKFKVSLTQMEARDVIIEAKDGNEAVNKVLDIWNTSGIELYYVDLATEVETADDDDPITFPED